MAYIPDPADPTQPVGTVKASTAAAEFRALKQYLAGFSSNGYPGTTGQGGNSLIATPAGGVTWSSVPSVRAFELFV